MLRTSSIALLLTAATAPLPAQDTIPTRLDTVVVSASKSPPGTAAAIQGVTVISGAELRAAGLTRAVDALRIVPGVAVAGNGAIGSVSSLFVRGGESRYTKVLIDGVAVNAVGGYFDFSHLSTDNLERIEIVRGPASVVHGADAMTGVVNVVTRRGSGPAVAELEARAGSYGSRDLLANISGATEALSYSLAGGRNSTDGILPFNNQYRNATLSGSVEFAPTGAGRVALTGRHGTARYHYPTDFLGFVEDSNAFRDQRRTTLSLKAGTRVAAGFELLVLAGTNDVADVTDDVEPPPPWAESTADVHSRFRSRGARRNVELRLSRTAPRLGMITAGGEYVRETERSVTSEAPVGTPPQQVSAFSGVRDTRVGFVELIGGGRIEYALSARIDDPSDHASFGTHRVGLATSVGSLRLRAAAGTAFNAPAFSQLLPTDWTVASPGLRPEHARSVEAGVDWESRHRRHRFGVTGFRQRFRDLIQFVGGPPPDFLGSYANLASAHADGWELSGGSRAGEALTINASYTRLHARVGSLDASYEGSLEAGQPLIRRPKHSATAQVAWLGWPRAALTLAARYVGSRPDLDFREFPSPLVTLPAHTVADVGGSVRVLGSEGAQTLALTLRIENVFDRSYQEVLYYDAPGRTILLGGRFSWSAR